MARYDVSKHAPTHPKGTNIAAMGCTMRGKKTYHRKTIARWALEHTFLPEDELFDKLVARFPNLENKISAEHVMTLVQVHKAIYEGDTRAYLAVMDSAYGSAKQTLEVEGAGANQMDLSKLSVEQLKALYDIKQQLKVAQPQAIEVEAEVIDTDDRDNAANE